MVWEEKDICDAQVCLLLNKVCSSFCAETDAFLFFSLVLQLLLIVQPPEHVALFSHCHASQCVFVNTHLPTHTNTISLTRLQATFLLMHTRVTSTEMNHLLI